MKENSRFLDLKTRPNRYKKCLQATKSQDHFGERFKMKLDSGNYELTSYAGLLITIITSMTIASYAYQKADVLGNRKDVDVLSTVNNFFYADDEVFSYKNGMNIAVGFTAYDSE